MSTHTPDILSPEKHSAALKNAEIITLRNIIKFQEAFPCSHTHDGIYRYVSKNDSDIWWHGFWCGIVWLLYELTKAEHVRCYGEHLTCGINRLLKNKGLSYSDIGFLVLPGCGSDFTLTGSTLARETVLCAADSLLTKYHPVSNIICSHDYEHQDTVLSCKISNLINVQILSFAGLLTGSTKYRKIALKNMEIIANGNIARDGRTYFYSFYDKATGILTTDCPVPHPKSVQRHETRAYAWALYGLMLCYKATGNTLYSERFRSVYSYLFRHIEENIIFRDTLQDGRAYDSTSTAITAAALTQMYWLTEDSPADLRTEYQKAASRLLNLLIDHYTPDPSSTWEGLLTHGFIHSTPVITSESTVCGDYFYLEALMNCRNSRNSCWVPDISRNSSFFS